MNINNFVDEEFGQHQRVSAETIQRVMCIGKTRFYELCKNDKNFPRPVCNGRRKLWIWGEILAYLRAQEDCRV